MIVLGLGTALPEVAVSQERAAAISTALVCRDHRQERLLQTLFRRAGVNARHTVLLQHPDAEPDLYRPPASEDDRGPSTAARMAVYEQAAAPLAARAASRALAGAALDPGDITHLITVSCTGFYAPGLDVDLIGRLRLHAGVARTHVGFMGCHGAFNALGLAGAIVGSRPTARVLVVSVELCTLHFCYEWDAEKLVANALFADGASAFVCGAGGSEKDLAAPALHIGPFASAVLPDSRAAMTWNVGDHGFSMTLSAAVPDLIRRHVPAWMNGWLSPCGLDAADVQMWAVHPGGPRILDAFEGAVQLSPAALATSRQVLGAHGNMSSATLGFILQAMRDGGGGGPGVAVGFGPGLTVEAFRFELGG